MTPRRDGMGGGFSPDKFAERLEQRDIDLRERMETLFKDAEARLKRIEMAVAMGSQERHSLANDIAEVRRDLGEGREATSLLRDELERHVAATETVRQVAANTAGEARDTAAGVFDRLTGMSKLGKSTAGGVVLMVVVFVITEGPAVVRFLNAWGSSVAAFWTGIGK